VIEIEKGHPRAEPGLALRALREFDIRLEGPPMPNAALSGKIPHIDIDAIIDAAEERKGARSKCR
jgi:hypothetical protein